MITTTEPTTVRHKIGTCPACRCGLYCEVQIVTEVHTPTLDNDGKARVYVNPRLMGMRVSHHCERDEDGEWTYPTPDPARAVCRDETTTTAEEATNAHR